MAKLKLFDEEKLREIVNEVFDDLVVNGLTVKECIGKQIPKKPYKTTDYTWGISREVDVCPSCDYYLNVYEWIETGHSNKKRITYCDRCGQAIDWSDTNEKQ